MVVETVNVALPCLVLTVPCCTSSAYKIISVKYQLVNHTIHHTKDDLSSAFPVLAASLRIKKTPHPLPLLLLQLPAPRPYPKKSGRYSPDIPISRSTKDDFTFAVPLSSHPN
jgi:hypothetical protein